jgi:hypothetical protein
MVRVHNPSQSHTAGYSFQSCSLLEYETRRPRTGADGQSESTKEEKDFMVF